MEDQSALASGEMRGGVGVVMRHRLRSGVRCLAVVCARPEPTALSCIVIGDERRRAVQWHVPLGRSASGRSARVPSRGFGFSQRVLRLDADTAVVVDAERPAAAPTSQRSTRALRDSPSGPSLSVFNRPGRLASMQLARPRFAGSDGNRRRRSATRAERSTRTFVREQHRDGTAGGSGRECIPFALPPPQRSPSPAHLQEWQALPGRIRLQIWPVSRSGPARQAAAQHRQPTRPASLERARRYDVPGPWRAPQAASAPGPTSQRQHRRSADRSPPEPPAVERIVLVLRFVSTLRPFAFDVRGVSALRRAVAGETQVRKLDPLFALAADDRAHDASAVLGLSCTHRMYRSLACPCAASLSRRESSDASAAVVNSSAASSLTATTLARARPIGSFSSKRIDESNRESSSLVDCE